MVWRSQKLAKVRLYWVMMARLHSSIPLTEEPPAGYVKYVNNIVWLDDEHVGVSVNIFPEGGGGTFSYWSAFNVATGEEVAEIEADTFRSVKHRSTLYTSGMKIEWTGEELIASDAGSPVQDTSGNLWFKDNVYGLALESVDGGLQVSLGEDDTSGPNIYLDSGTGSRIIYQDLAFKDDWILAKHSRKAKDSVISVEGVSYTDREPLFVDLPGEAGSFAKLTDPDLWYYIRSGNEQSDIVFEYQVSTAVGTETREFLVPLEAINNLATYDSTVYDPSAYSQGYELLQERGEGVALELQIPRGSALLSVCTRYQRRFSAALIWTTMR